MKIYLLCAVVALVCLLLLFPSCAKQQSLLLSRDMLLRATTISLYTDIGTVAPEYRYSLTVTVKPDSVRLELTQGYSNETGLVRTAVLSPERYQAFVNALAALSVRKVKDNPDPPAGGSATSIRVRANGETLFVASDGLNLTCDGNLTDVFRNVLPDELSQEFARAR